MYVIIWLIYCLINVVMMYIKFVEEFLKKCFIPKTTSLKDSCWMRLLKVIVDRFVTIALIPIQ